MIRWKKMRREPLPNGTILSFLNGEEFVLQALLAENKNALFYEVRSQTTGQAVVLKEFFNSHWVRLRGAPALKGWEQEPPDSRKLSRTYLWLRRQAEQEQHSIAAQRQPQTYRKYGSVAELFAQHRIENHHAEDLCRTADG